MEGTLLLKSLNLITSTELLPAQHGKFPGNVGNEINAPQVSPNNPNLLPG